jgi:hypothetical protein
MTSRARARRDDPPRTRRPPRLTDVIQYTGTQAEGEALEHSGPLPEICVGNHAAHGLLSS